MSDTVYDCPNYPLLLILSGPSGVGKDTVARMLIERRPDSFYFVVTATTRPPRDNEHHGVDYIFVTFDEFARMIEENMWRAIRYGRDGNLLDLQRARVSLGAAGATSVQFRGGKLSVSGIELDSEAVEALGKQVEGVLYEWRAQEISVRVTGDADARLAAVRALADGLSVVRMDMLPDS